MHKPVANVLKLADR